MKYPQLVSMPSAVSDWLEEQLEARGIDSEVYTRYILSLLHAHTLDVIYPEEDPPFSQLKKDGGRIAGSHKRVRRTGAWWRHADADAEQIKRSAAVECLMSAAEQNCEIESLVDELCEKLKEVNSKAEESPSETQQDSKSNKEPSRSKKISPKELAERYYAAFPPLNQKDANSYLTSNINLVVGKWPSPEKNIDLIAAKWSSSGSPKKAKRKPKRQQHDNMKSTSKAGQNRNRFGYKKAHCVRTLTREMADNQANWEFVYNNNNSYAINDRCLDSFVPAVSEALPEYINMDENDFPVQWMKDWMAEAEQSNQNTAENSLQRNTIKRPQFIPVYTSSIWSNEGSSGIWSKDEQSKEKEESWSPIEEEESAIREEYQRCLEDDECAIKMEYERPCIEDVKVHVGGGGQQWSLDLDGGERSVQIGGRWSTRMDQQIDHVSQDAVDFGLVKPDDNRGGDDLLDFNMQNEANSLLENINQRDFTPSVFRSFHSLPPSIWSDHDVINMPFSENECLFDVQTISLMKIGHHKECSAFGKYVRPAATQDNESLLLPLSGPYSRPFGRPLKGPNMPAKVVPAAQVPEGEMWESPLVLFKPIRTPVPKEEPKEETARKYQDGATFPVSGNLDKVDFKRTNSGTLFIETEFGESRKYLEYHWQPPSDNSLNISRSPPKSDSNGFKLKFWVSQNDKAIQTENQMEELLPFAEDFNKIKETAYKIMENMDFDGEAEDTKILSREAVQEKQGKCEKCGGTRADDSKGILKFINREVDYLESENLLEIADMVWKDSDETCKFCEVNHQWPNFMQKFDINWDSETLKDIWEGAGCRTSGFQNSREHSPSIIGTTSQLREEIQEDAERLLSDLSSVQQAYSDSSRFTQENQFKPEVVATLDRKRRHSYMDSDREMWSFATRLQEDCLINLSTLPTRRSVTL